MSHRIPCRARSHYNALGLLILAAMITSLVLLLCLP